MKRIVLALALTGLTACASKVTDSAAKAPDDRTPQGLASPSPEAAVHSAAIRQLILVDHGYGKARPPYKVVYVLNGPVPGAEDSNKLVSEIKPATTFSPEMQRQIVNALPDLPPVQFVPDREAVITGEAPGHVINDGVLVTLGPVQWEGSAKATIGSSRWANGLNGQWVTYVFNYSKAEWRIAGTTGTTAIS